MSSKGEWILRCCTSDTACSLFFFRFFLRGRHGGHTKCIHRSIQLVGERDIFCRLLLKQTVEIHAHSHYFKLVTVCIHFNKQIFLVPRFNLRINSTSDGIYSFVLLTVCILLHFRSA